MGKIKRYDYYFVEGLYSSEVGMEESKHGGYVGYEDHERIVGKMQTHIEDLEDALFDTQCKMCEMVVP